MPKYRIKVEDVSNPQSVKTVYTHEVEADVDRLRARAGPSLSRPPARAGGLSRPIRPLAHPPPLRRIGLPDGQHGGERTDRRGHRLRPVGMTCRDRQGHRAHSLSPLTTYVVKTRRYPGSRQWRSERDQNGRQPHFG